MMYEDEIWYVEKIRPARCRDVMLVRREARAELYNPEEEKSKAKDYMHVQVLLRLGSTEEELRTW